MRVAIVNPPLLGHEKRGTGVYTQNLIEALGKVPQIETVSCELSYLPTNVDLYHFPYFDPFFLTLPPIRSKKTVVTIHDLIPLKFPEHFPRGIKGEIKWQIQRFIVKRTDAVITDSRASASDISNFTGIPSAKIFPIHLAPSNHFLKAKDKTAYQHIKEKYHLPQKFILYVGDMNWNKNVIQVIRAAINIKIPLVIVSKSFIERHDTSYNPWKENLIEAQNLARDNKLIYKIGHIQIEDLVAIYKLAACLVFPSFYEGFGLPVVEAFAAGCPVITTNKGSLSEIVNDAALIVDPYDLKTIEAAIIKILSDSYFKRDLIAKGKQQVKHFTWQKTAEATVEVYKLVLGNHK